MNIKLIRTTEEVKNLDPDTIVFEVCGDDSYAHVVKNLFYGDGTLPSETTDLLPLAVLAAGDDTREIRKVIEQEKY